MTGQRPEARKPYHFYGRRQGRRLTEVQKQLMATLLPTLTLAPEGVLTPPSWAHKAVLEVGFGNGEHLLHCAALHPDTAFVGIEPYRNGVAKTLVGIDAQNLSNIQLYAGDARDVLPRFAPMMFDRIYVLFPDPWPKKRHHERRILQHDFILALVRLLKVNGELCIASDDAAYIHHVLVLMQGVPALRWTATRQADWQTPFTPEVTTAFHRKAMQAGRACIFLRFALEG